MDTSAYYDTVEWLRPAQDLWPVIPSDTVPHPPFRALWVGTPGDVCLVTRRGSSVIVKNVPTGWLDVSGLQVKATGTTAANLLGAE